MIKEIVFATNNQHKLAELRQMVGDNIKLLSLSDINCHDEIEENGTTLRENALIKARYVKDKYGYDCFADDTGMMVDALDGEPGVYSARYAGEDCNSEHNIDKVLTKMKGCNNRDARFVTMVALIVGDKVDFFEGKVEGTILTERHGEGGFGYDAIFKPLEADKSFAEMNAAEKNAISHRGRAIAKLVEYLRTA